MFGSEDLESYLHCLTVKKAIHKRVGSISDLSEHTDIFVKRKQWGGAFFSFDIWPLFLNLPVPLNQQ